MIIDSMERLADYASVHPRFPRAIAYLQELLANGAADGRHVLEGTDIPEEIYVNLATGALKLKDTARAESHRKYIDIQVMLAGEEMMYVPTVPTEADTPYEEAKDCMHYADVPFADCHCLLVKEGNFAIFFTNELHAPSMAVGNQPASVRKAVVKVLA